MGRTNRESSQLAPKAMMKPAMAVEMFCTSRASESPTRLLRDVASAERHDPSELLEF